MKKLISIFLLCLMGTLFLSCTEEDENGETCAPEPAGCITSAPSTGVINIKVTINVENNPVTVNLRTGENYDSGTDYMNFTTSDASTSLTVPLGSYSAQVEYHFTYKGTLYHIQAVDGDTVSYSSNSYCDDVVCYEEDLADFELEFDEEEFIAMLENENSNCFIATAAYGSPDSWQVEYLRNFRDAVLLKNPAGRRFTQKYYTCSPYFADCIRGSEFLKLITRILLSILIAAIEHPYAAFTLTIFFAFVLFNRKRLRYLIRLR